MRSLFVLKKNWQYSFSHMLRRSSGLWNSTRFIVESLEKRGLESRIVEVVDNNDIDREVSAYYETDRRGNRKPMKVVIEALWVVPEKFDVLMALHPKVEWWIHLHSNMPFLASEGMGMEWVIESAKRGVRFIANSVESYDALRAVLPKNRLIYLPNVYLTEPMSAVRFDWGKPVLDVGCYGAVRPLKNHLLQALSAIRFAQEIGKRLRFHVNSTRVEGKGEPVLKNLIALFARTHDAELIQEAWFEPSDFIPHLHRNIDIGMQVSLSETFNVVTADYVTAGIPIVVSDEVKWCSTWNVAEEDSIHEVVNIMHRALGNRPLIWWNQYLLQGNSFDAQELWAEWSQVKYI